MYSEHAKISLSDKGRVNNEIINMIKQSGLEVEYTVSGINVNIKCKAKRGLKVFGVRINNDKKTQ